MPNWLLRGEVVPALDLTLVDGRTLRLPDGLDNEFTLLLVYRAHW